MADTETATATATDATATPAPAPPAAPPKEKKKKRSVKASEKTSKAAALAAEAAENAAAAMVTQVPRAKGEHSPTRGEFVPVVAPDSLARELAPLISDDPSIVSILKKPLKFLVAGESGEPEPILGEDGEEAPPKVVDECLDAANEIDDAEARAKEKKMMMEENKLRELAEAFYLLDFNQDGLICKKDLHMTFSSLGRADMPDNEIQRMLDEADSPLDFEAFVKLLGHKTVDLDSEDTLVAALAQWDPEGTGMISEPRVRHDLKTWGDKFSEQEVDYALEDAPLYAQEDGDLLFDYAEFCRVLCGLSANEF